MDLLQDENLKDPKLNADAGFYTYTTHPNKRRHEETMCKAWECGSCLCVKSVAL
jgi:hypothetical protein